MKKTYTIQKMAGVPSLTIRGKFLDTEFGVQVGTRLKLIEGKNMLILVKVPYEEETTPSHVCNQCKKCRSAERKNI